MNVYTYCSHSIRNHTAHTQYWPSWRYIFKNHILKTSQVLNFTKLWFVQQKIGWFNRTLKKISWQWIIWDCAYIVNSDADGGPHSCVRARGTLRSAPRRHQRNLFAARVCIVTCKHLPQPLQPNEQPFNPTTHPSTQWATLQKKPKKSLKKGQRGSPRILFWLESYFFCD